MKFSEDLRDLLMRMGEEDPSDRDVTLQDVIELYIDYKDTVDEDMELSALLSSDVTEPSHQDTTEEYSLARYYTLVYCVVVIYYLMIQ